MIFKRSGLNSNEKEYIKNEEQVKVIKDFLSEQVMFEDGVNYNFYFEKINKKELLAFNYTNTVLEKEFNKIKRLFTAVNKLKNELDLENRENKIKEEIKLLVDEAESYDKDELENNKEKQAEIENKMMEKSEIILDIESDKLILEEKMSEVIKILHSDVFLNIISYFLTRLYVEEVKNNRTFEVKLFELDKQTVEEFMRLNNIKDYNKAELIGEKKMIEQYLQDYVTLDDIMAITNLIFYIINDKITGTKKK